MSYTLTTKAQNALGIAIANMSGATLSTVMTAKAAPTFTPAAPQYKPSAY